MKITPTWTALQCIYELVKFSPSENNHLYITFVPIYHYMIMTKHNNSGKRH